MGGDCLGLFALNWRLRRAGGLHRKINSHHGARPTRCHGGRGGERRDRGGGFRRESATTDHCPERARRSPIRGPHYVARVYRPPCAPRAACRADPVPVFGPRRLDLAHRDFSRRNHPRGLSATTNDLGKSTRRSNRALYCLGLSPPMARRGMADRSQRVVWRAARDDLAPLFS